MLISIILNNVFNILRNVSKLLKINFLAYPRGIESIALTQTACIDVPTCDNEYKCICLFIKAAF